MGPEIIVKACTKVHHRLSNGDLRLLVIGSNRSLHAAREALGSDLPIPAVFETDNDWPALACLQAGPEGEVIDEPALAAALRAGTIAGAGLDTFAPEPPAADNPLWQIDNVIVSPHVGGVTEEARHEVSLQTVRNVLTLLNAEPVAARYLVHA